MGKINARKNVKGVTPQEKRADWNDAKY